MSNIIKPDEPGSAPLLKGGKLRSQPVNTFAERIRAATASRPQPESLPNRICLLLDCSSSMSHQEEMGNDRYVSRIDLLKEAVGNFSQRCDYSDTALAIETFPSTVCLSLVSSHSVIQNAMFGIQASGSTPMRHCVEAVIAKHPITRAVIVSDGEASDWSRGLDDFNASNSIIYDPSPLKPYIEAGIPIDTVHIGSSQQGEALLRQIAERTKGVYIKFTDVSAFALNFGYLAPAFRAMLGDGSVDLKQLGADEVKV